MLKDRRLIWGRSRRDGLVGMADCYAESVCVWGGGGGAGTHTGVSQCLVIGWICACIADGFCTAVSHLCLCNVRCVPDEGCTHRFLLLGFSTVSVHVLVQMGVHDSCLFR